MTITSNGAGMPRSKLVIGIPFYGVTFKLKDPADHNVGAPVAGIGMFDGEVTYPQVSSISFIYSVDLSLTKCGPL